MDNPLAGKLAKAADLAAARLLPPVRGARLGLVSLMFHGVFLDRKEAEGGTVDPFQPMTLAGFDALLGQLRGLGFRFVTGRDIGRAEGPAVWLTFDDGYASNLRLIPLLDRHDACATIFVATRAIETGQGYWWDVLWRESLRRGRKPAEIARTREAMKALHPARIEARLVAEFGEAALRPVGEADRPMTLDELRAVARHPRIEIGNHTHSHMILPRHPAAEAAADIARAQELLARWTGGAPVSTAYPNGEASAPAIAGARAAGLTVGVTGLPGREPLPARPDHLMALHRYPSFRDDRIARELALVRSPLSLSARRSDRLRHRLLGVS